MVDHAAPLHAVEGHSPPLSSPNAPSVPEPGAPASTAEQASHIKEVAGSVEWADTFDRETVRLAYEEAAKLPPLYGEISKTIETKTVSVFTVGAAVLGFAPIFRQLHPTGLDVIPWFIAVGAFLIAAFFCREAYRPRDMRVDPNPTKLASPDWLELEPDHFRFFRLRDMGTTYDQVREILNERGRYVTYAMWAVALEVAALTFALVSSS